MRRRNSILALLALAAQSVSFPLRAQQAAHRRYRIALVPDFPPGWAGIILKILADTLRQRGRIEGRDYVIYRSGVYYGPDTTLALDRALAAKPDLIIVMNLGSAIDAYKRTRTIPIVMWISGFPVEGGVADSLARPGRNVTGLTIYAGGEFFGKLLDLLHEAKPGIRRVGFFMSYVPPYHPRAETDLIIKGLRDAAGPLGIDLRVFEISKPAQVDDALAGAAAQGVQALVLTSDSSIEPRKEGIMRFAVARHLPTITDARWFGTKPEPLLQYYAPGDVLMRQAATYVERILWESAKPGDLPIQLPTRFKFLVSAKTAKAIGLTIPPALLIRADEIVR
jgi:ABC-type uncharacterized transport system substrate-binding protein